ncbi:CPXCG motif-containing cysteine-rich protein [Bacteroidota bacterium]
MTTDEVLKWTCQYCSEENELWVDLTIEDKQDLIEDCETCCRPNRLIISQAMEEGVPLVESRLTDE